MKYLLVLIATFTLLAGKSYAFGVTEISSVGSWASTYCSTNHSCENVEKADNREAEIKKDLADDKVQNVKPQEQK